MPCGSARRARRASASSSTGSASSSRGTRRRSRARRRAPSPKLTFGRGEKPCVNASGSSATRNARSNAAREVAVAEMKRTLPRFEKRSRTGKPASPRTDDLRSMGRSLRRTGHRSGTGIAAAAVEILTRALAAAGRRDRATRRRARAPSRCTRHSRSRASTGSRGARARPAPPPVLPEEVAVQTRPRCGPRAAPRPRWRWRVTYQSGSRPSAAIASSHRVEVEALAPLLERPARRARPARSRADAAVATARDPLGERRLGVVPLAAARPCGAVASRSSPTLRRSSSTPF